MAAQQNLPIRLSFPRILTLSIRPTAYNSLFLVSSAILTPTTTPNTPACSDYMLKVIATVARLAQPITLNHGFVTQNSISQLLLLAQLHSLIKCN